jgi:hypothetical protein
MPFKSVSVEVNGVPHKQCSMCEEVKPLSDFRLVNKSKGYRNGRCVPCDRLYQSQWQKKVNYGAQRRYNERTRAKYIETVKFANHKRRARGTTLATLPDSLSVTEWREIREHFDNKCAISGSENIAIEHFIPLSWGHGGTILGNVYPLDSDLNLSKSDKNPFEWAAEQDIDLDAWKRLVAFLAVQNGLSVDDFKAFVYWCEDNKKFSSIELWRMTNGL